MSDDAFMRRWLGFLLLVFIVLFEISQWQVRANQAMAKQAIAIAEHCLER